MTPDNDTAISNGSTTSPATCPAPQDCTTHTGAGSGPCARQNGQSRTT